MEANTLHQAALRLLARREYSRFELSKKLETKDFDSLQIKKELDALQQAGLQSDLRFTEAFINDRIRAGYGPRTIRFMLEERGITRALIDQFMSVYSVDFWQEQLRTLWHKRFNAQKSKKTADYLAEKARQYRFLSYRGFEAQDIYLLLRQVFNE